MLFLFFRTKMLHFKHVLYAFTRTYFSRKLLYTNVKTSEKWLDKFFDGNGGFSLCDCPGAEVILPLRTEVTHEHLTFTHLPTGK